MSSISKRNIDQSLKFVYSDNNSLSVIFHDNDLLMGVVGEFNKNLKDLEKITQSSLYSRGNSILIKSNPQKISLEISRTDITSNMVFLSPLDAFGNFTGVSIFTNDLMEVLAQINLFKDFENVAVVDLSLVNKTYLPKIMSMPKSEIRKKFSKSIETRIWTETMIEKIKILS